MHLFRFLTCDKLQSFHLQYSFLITINMHRTINPLNNHFTQLTLTQIHLGTNTTNLRLFWKITLGGDPLCMIVSCQCSLGVWEAVNPLVGSIGKGLETITSYVFLKLHNGISGLLQPFIIIQKESTFFLHTYIHKSLILAPKLDAPKINETCPNFSRIVHGNFMFSFYNYNKHAQNNKST